MLTKLRQIYSDMRFAVVRYFRTREVVKTLHVAHATELAHTDGELWPITKQRHRQEIADVRAGNFTITERRSWQYPYLPEALHRLSQPILKNTPYNLRRFSETPIPRRAINLIKNAILSLPWKVDIIEEFDENEERQKRVEIATKSFEHPNNVDSWKTMMEAVLEDIIIGAYGTLEPAMTPYYKRPFKLWPVDGSTVRIYPDWMESHPERPKYAQMTGMQNERGLVNFRDDQLIYIRDNVRTNTPFGLGKLEVAFNSVNAFLGIQEMSSRAGADQIHKTWMWWKKPQSVGHMNTVVRHTQNEGEGQSKISFMAGMEPPEIVDVQAVSENDLLPWWQEFLVRIIAQGFDLSPMALGLERDVNRNTSEVMSTMDFRSAVVPMASRVAESMTSGVLHKFMGWKDLEFKFIGLDDPDMITKMAIFSQQSSLDAITPDEIREDLGKKEIPGGFGKLTLTQRQILVQLAAAIMQKDIGGERGGMGMGSPFGMPGMGRGTSQGVQTPKLPKVGSSPGAGLPPGAKLPMSGSMFSTADVVGMSPSYIMALQDMNLLPETPKLKEKMEDQDPDVFEKLSEALRKFFEFAEKQEEKVQIEPEEVSKADESTQLQRYRQGLKELEDLEDSSKRTGWSDEDVLHEDDTIKKRRKK